MAHNERRLHWAPLPPRGGGYEEDTTDENTPPATQHQQPPNTVTAVRYATSSASPGEIAALTKEMEKRDGRLKECNLRLRAAEEKLHEAEVARASLEEEVSLRDQEVRDLRRDRRELEVAKREAEERQKRAEADAAERIRQLSAELQRFQTEAKGKEDRTTASEARVAQLEKQLETEQRKVRDLSLETTHLSRELERRKAELTDLQEKRKREVASRLAELETSRSSSKEMFDQVDLEARELRERVAQLELEVRLTEDTTQLGEEQLRATRQELESCMGRLKDAQQALIAKEDEVQNLREKLNDALASLEAVEEASRKQQLPSTVPGTSGTATSQREAELRRQIDSLRQDLNEARRQATTSRAPLVGNSLSVGAADNLLRRQLQEKEDENTSLRSRLIDHTEELEALRAEIEEKHKAYQEALQRAHEKELLALELQGALNTVRSDLAKAQLRAKDAEEQARESMKDGERITLRSPGTGGRSGGFDAPTGGSAMVAIVKDRDSLRAERDSKEKQLVEVREQLAQSKAEARQLTQKLEERRVVESRQQAEAGEARRKEIQELQRTVQNQEWALDDARKQCDRLQAELDDALATKRSLDERLKEFEQNGGRRKEVVMLEMELRQLRDRRQEEELLRKELEKHLQIAREELKERVSTLEEEKARLARNLGQKDQEVERLHYEAQQHTLETQALRRGIEERDERMQEVQLQEQLRSRQLVAEIESRLKETEATQLAKKDQELVVMHRRVLAMQTKVKELDAELRATGERLRDTETGREAVERELGVTLSRAEQLASAVSEREQACLQSQQRIDDLTEQLRQLDSSQRLTNLELSRRHQQVEDLNRRVAEAASEGERVFTLEAEVRSLQDERKGLQALLSDRETQLAALREAKRQVEARLLGAVQQQDRLRDAAREAEQAAEAVRRRAEETESERERLAVDLARARRMTEEMEAQAKAAARSAQELKDKDRATSDDKERSEAERRKAELLGIELLTRQKQLEEMEAQLGQVRQEKDQLAIKAMQQEQQAERNSAHSQARIRELENIRMTLTEELQQLREEISAGKATNSRLRKELQDVQDRFSAAAQADEELDAQRRVLRVQAQELEKLQAQIRSLEAQMAQTADESAKERSLLQGQVLQLQRQLTLAENRAEAAAAAAAISITGREREWERDTQSQTTASGAAPGEPRPTVNALPAGSSVAPHPVALDSRKKLQAWEEEDRQRVAALNAELDRRRRQIEQWDRQRPTPLAVTSRTAATPAEGAEQAHEDQLRLREQGASTPGSGDSTPTPPAAAQTLPQRRVSVMAEDPPSQRENRSRTPSSSAARREQRLKNEQAEAREKQWWAAEQSIVRESDPLLRTVGPVLGAPTSTALQGASRHPAFEGGTRVFAPNAEHQRSRTTMTLLPESSLATPSARSPAAPSGTPRTLVGSDNRSPAVVERRTAAIRSRSAEDLGGVSNSSGSSSARWVFDEGGLRQANAAGGPAPGQRHAGPSPRHERPSMILVPGQKSGGNLQSPTGNLRETRPPY